MFGNTVRYEDSGLTEDWSQFVDPRGQIRALMIAQDFPDVPAVTKFSQMESFAKDIEAEFDRLSNGNAQFEVTLRQGWLRMPSTAKHYAAADWWEKINDALRLADSEFDFREFDMFIIKTDEKNFVINVAGALPKYDNYKPDGLDFTQGVYLGADGWTREGGGLGIAIHEIGHLFGLPDLYGFNEDGTRPVGLFDLMGSSEKDHLLRLSGWHLWKLGWLSSPDVQCLDPQELQQFSVPANQQSQVPFVFPISTTKALVVETWKPFSNRDAAHWVAYSVDSMAHIGAWGQPSGLYSPIQVLTPKGVKRSTEWGARNAELALNPGQSIETEIGTFKFVKGGKQLAMRFEPKGTFENRVPQPKLQIAKVRVGYASSSATSLRSSVFAKANRELSKYPAQSVRCNATVPRFANASVVNRAGRLAKALCQELKLKQPHLGVSQRVIRSGTISTKILFSKEIRY